MNPSIMERAKHFGEAQQIEIEEQLGFGWDGTVFATDRQSAIKVFNHERLYQRERDVYLRLQSRQVSRLLEFKIPRLMAYDNDLWIVEMTIVSPPFALDFAGAYLDQKPDYPPEVMADWRAEKAEQFGESHWSRVQALMWAFSKLGVYLADVKPGNIVFGDEDET